MNTTELQNFKWCAEEAPAGTYEEAKRLNDLIGNTVDNFMRELREMSLKADNCDGAFKLETAIYAYVKTSNPDSAMFPCAEGFGEAMNGPARERVLRQAVQERDFLAVIQGR